jgi:outer membrane protein assembly factor BamE (lipoprotein component of BamABCDE complex)
MKTIFTMLVTALLCGCAGTYFTFDRAALVKPGMTEAEVQKIMGRPNSVTSTAASLLWVYVFADGFSGSVRSVSFGFDTNGLVNSVPRIPQSFLTGNTNGFTPAHSPKSQ